VDVPDAFARRTRFSGRLSEASGRLIALQSPA
jgi:hypothetical protein